MLERPNICYIFKKLGVQGFKILFWLPSFDDTVKDKHKHKILCISRGEYFLSGKFFSEVNIFQAQVSLSNQI